MHVRICAIPEKDLREAALQKDIVYFANGVVIVRDGKILVVRRVPDDSLGGYYELPGGGVDNGENFAEAAIRETLEETGLEVTAILAILDGFDYPTRTKSMVRQFNFVVETAPGDVRLSPTEHDDYRWITAPDIDNLHTTDAMKSCLHDVFKALPTLDIAV